MIEALGLSSITLAASSLRIAEKEFAHFGANRWQEAVEAATQKMIEQLASLWLANCPLGN